MIFFSIFCLEEIIAYRIKYQYGIIAMVTDNVLIVKTDMLRGKKCHEKIIIND